MMITGTVILNFLFNLQNLPHSSSSSPSPLLLLITAVPHQTAEKTGQTEDEDDHHQRQRQRLALRQRDEHLPRPFAALQVFEEVVQRIELRPQLVAGLFHQGKQPFLNLFGNVADYEADDGQSKLVEEGGEAEVHLALELEFGVID